MTAVQFITHKLEFPGGHVWLDGNSKISGWKPVANAFSLVEIQDCPYRTPTCEKVCYVHGLKKYSPETHERYEHNSRVVRWTPNLKDIGPALAGYITEHCQETGFRWHVSGDIFSDNYAHWISDIVFFTPKVRHWIYTRSFPMIGWLLDVPNLRLNLSADRHNYWLARRVWEQHKDAPSRPHICYLADGDGEVPEDLPEGSVVFPDYSLRERAVSPAAGRTGSQWYQSLRPEVRAGVCPVDFHGAREDRRCGPCRKCL